MQPTVSIETITPDAAELLLDGNVDNRKLREHRVRRYQASIEAGDWTLTGDAICDSPSGRLLNGQHRLSAIARANKPVQILVLRNCPESSFAAMDQGMARSVGDLFRSRHVQYANDCAACARFVWFWLQGSGVGQTGGVLQPTPVEVERVYIEYKDEIDQGVIIGGSLQRLYAKSRIAFVDVLLRIDHGTDVDVWWDLVDPQCPRGLDKGHPARTLRDHMLLHADARKMPTQEFACKAIKCFNAWAEGRDMGKVAYNPNEAFPEVAKQIRPEIFLEVAREAA
jgi:hypothetical protein